MGERALGNLEKAHVAEISQALGIKLSRRSETSRDTTEELRGESSLPTPVALSDSVKARAQCSSELG